MWNGVLAGQEDAAKINVEHAIPVLDRQLLAIPHDVNRRIIHEDVEATELPGRSLDQLLHMRRVRKVRAEEEAGSTKFFDFF